MESNQRSDEWIEQRLGKFTASETHKLMSIKGLGETGKTYAFEKAIEHLFGQVEEQYISYDMQNGIDLEPLAFKKFSELKALQFLEVESCGFFDDGDETGSSPDGLVSDDAVLEIKCPKVNTFFKLVLSNEIDKKYFYQMQKQMKSTNRSKAYFFNYIVIEGKEYWHEIVVLRDQGVIDLIDIREKEAIKIKWEYIDLIDKNRQF